MGSSVCGRRDENKLVRCQAHFHWGVAGWETMKNRFSNLTKGTSSEIYNPLNLDTFFNALKKKKKVDTNAALRLCLWVSLCDNGHFWQQIFNWREHSNPIRGDRGASTTPVCHVVSWLMVFVGNHTSRKLFFFSLIARAKGAQEFKFQRSSFFFFLNVIMSVPQWPRVMINTVCCWDKRKTRLGPTNMCDGGYYPFHLMVFIPCAFILELRQEREDSRSDHYKTLKT